MTALDRLHEAYQREREALAAWERAGSVSVPAWREAGRKYAAVVREIRHRAAEVLEHLDKANFA